MITLIELGLVVAVLLVGFIGWQAHQKHTTLAAQAEADKALLLDKIAAVGVKARGDLVALEAKFTKQPPAPPPAA